ncbi:MAG: zinc ribbon domain-containing protein [Candidatus Heimdallarchaeota archaeon]|nr:zinc ribbon domain-containing protein [Candidatus Heimdallarchaeota archaeon]
MITNRAVQKLDIETSFVFFQKIPPHQLVLALMIFVLYFFGGFFYVIFATESIAGFLIYFLGIILLLLGMLAYFIMKYRGGTQEVMTSKASKICPGCGEKVDMNDKFCMDCGATLDITSKPVNESKW